MLFSLYSSVGGFLILFAMNGFEIEISMFSVMAAVIYSLVGIMYTIAGIKALGCVNLSVYSVLAMLAMLGGMLLPSLYGIIFLNEAVTIPKIVCCVFMFGALALATERGGKSEGRLYYAAVFVLNGLVGVVSAIHQSNAEAVASLDFLILARLAAVIMSLPFCIPLRLAKKMTTRKSLVYSLEFAAFCGVGNLLVLVALKHLPASVQYPIITGGVMVVSLFISLARKERVGLRTVISTVLAFAATAAAAIS